jgi:hypothetical protein
MWWPLSAALNTVGWGGGLGGVDLQNMLVFGVTVASPSAHEKRNAFFHRYGDPFNPWGDLMSIARAWCITKPGGSLIIGIPFEPDQGETIVWVQKHNRN